MSFSEADYKKIRVHLGPKMIEYLELIGIESYAELKDLDPVEIQLKMNEALGRPNHINSVGLKALEKLIESAIND